MIAVFTPTFNRAYSLPCLFESLQRQTYRDFEWIIVDDGSSDATQNLCQSFIEKAAFPMRCFWQENSVKHADINFGANVAKGVVLHRGFR